MFKLKSQGKKNHLFNVKSGDRHSILDLDSSPELTPSFWKCLINEVAPVFFFMVQRSVFNLKSDQKFISTQELILP